MITASILDLILGWGGLFHYLRLPAYWGTMRRIESALALQPDERLLDVGCGTGVGSRLGKRMYVGVDRGLNHLRFAARRSSRSSCMFAAMSALDLGVADRAFEKALLINVAHHLDDDALDRLLTELKRVVRTKIVVVDAAPEDANRLEAFLFRHDRGDHVRGRRVLRSFLSRHHVVEREEVFHNRLHTVRQVLFSLVPKDAAG
jgi:SAM-dependent methyltransferase